MFLFTPEHIAMIIDGNKEETRRVGKWKANVGSIHQGRLTLFGKWPIKIRVLKRWEERLDRISVESARNEGLYTRDDYIFGFLGMHKGNPEIRRWSEVKCYKFELMEVAGWVTPKDINLMRMRIIPEDALK